MSTIVPSDFDFERRRSSTMLVDSPEHTVLVQDQHHVRLFPFSGTEEEDFTDVYTHLIDYIGVKGIKDKVQKLSILRSILRNGARLEFEKAYPMLDTLNFDTVCQEMLAKYNTNKSLYRKEEAFEESRQLPGESPANFLTRINEMALRADIKDDEKRIFRRFRFGLLPEYARHCQLMGAETHAEFYKYSMGLWRTHYQPFLPKHRIENYPSPSSSSNEVIKSVSFTELIEPATKHESSPSPQLTEEKLRKMMKKIVEETLERKLSSALQISNKKIDELQAATKKLEEATDKKIFEAIKANDKKKKESGNNNNNSYPRANYPQRYSGPYRQNYGPPTNYPPRNSYGAPAQNYYGQPYGPPRPVGPPGTNGPPSNHPNNGNRAVGPSPPQGNGAPFNYHEDAQYFEQDAYYHHEYQPEYTQEYYSNPPASVSQGSQLSKN
ncbi:hypothetical protein INT46_008662 [Mucor plumbeus]|uniref:Gag protein n=1 Tax=Mucor plumbeus TaxID=97098 RepID=A0A8H7QPI4_9FUNG|nr:hypothetical protein INT46_008662 [Mucor plumbeus]